MKRVDLLFVCIQLLLFAGFAFAPRSLEFPLTINSYWSRLLYGLAACGGIISALSVLNLGESLSPFPTPKATGVLKQHGLYKLVRHPIYSGLLLFAYAFALATLHGPRLIIAVLLHVLFHFKARYEEGQLEKKYEHYTTYKERTGRFFPYLNAFNLKR